MNPRRIALSALMDITDKNAYANLRLKSLPDDLDSQEIKRICALVYTTLDHLLYIDWLLGHVVKGRQKPVIQGILRLGVCEILYFKTPIHAAVSEYVSLTRQVGKAPLSGLVNAVLRKIASMSGSLPPLPTDPVERLSIQYSYPKWLIAEWVAEYGESFTEALLCAPPADMSVRAQYPYTADALMAALPVPAKRGALDENCLLLDQGLDVTSLAEFVDGKMAVQGQSAMLACRALGNCRGKRVLDACAAPGNKSAYLASLAQNDLALTSMELHPHRKELLDKTLARLHVCATTLCHDATEPISEFFAAFHMVLLDAPCSGLGLTGSKPDIRYAKSDEDVLNLSKLQQALLNTCQSYVSNGGVLLYVTCTISRRENEDNVDAFLREHPDFQLESMEIPVENQGMIQLFPHVHHTDGFFLARLRRCI